MRKLPVLLIILMLLFASTGLCAFRPAAVGDLFHKGASGFDVRSYGAVGDGSTDDEPAFTLAIAAAAGGRVIIPEAVTSYRLSSNVTVPAGVEVVFQRGGLLLIDNSITFTVNGTIRAGLYQIFSGAGTATLATGSCEYLLPQWWGAVGDDSTDNIAAFNLAAGQLSKIGTMYIPSGVYRISTTFNNFPDNFYGEWRTAVVVEGAGMSDTIIKYTGTSGFAIEIGADPDNSFWAPHYMTIRDLRIEAASLSSAGGGVLLAGVSNTRLDNIGFKNIDTTYGVCVHARQQEDTISEAFTADTDNDFTTTGAGASEQYAVKFTATTTGRVKTVTVPLGKTGAPAGTTEAYIYSDDGGAPSEPDTQIGGVTGSVTNTALSAAAGGADQDLTFVLFADMPPIVATTDYWVVCKTTGYTYTDGVTEVRLRVEAAAGDADEFATFDTGGAGWGTSNDGVDNDIVYRSGQNLANYLHNVHSNDSVKANTFVKMEENSQFNISDCDAYAIKGFDIEGSPTLFVQNSTIQTSSTGSPLSITGGGTSFWLNNYFEGGGSGNPMHFDGGKHFMRHNSLGVNLTWTTDTELDLDGNWGPLWKTADAAIKNTRLQHKIYSMESPWLTFFGSATGADADALNGVRAELGDNTDYVLIEFNNNTASQLTFFTKGTYKFTIYAKDTNQVADDLRLYVVNVADSFTLANERFTATADYRPYSVFVHVKDADVGNRIQVYGVKQTNSTGTLYFSHFVIEYMGGDDPYRKDLIAYNEETLDGDGDRESKVLFQGRQTGLEQSLLASITASHDGAVDDEKGKLETAINDGSDGFAPTVIETIDSTGETIVGTMAATTVTGANVTTGADPGHTHTGSSVGTIDISDDTNLAVTAPITLTDDTVGITVAKDIVAGGGLTGGEDNVLPGADADTTVAVGAGDGVIVNADEIEVFGLVASDGSPNNSAFVDADGNLIVGPGSKHDGQVTRKAAEVQTTDATVTTLESITLLEGNTYLIEAWVTATQSDESARAVYKIITGAKRTTAGSAALFGSVVSIITSEEEASWDCTFDANVNDIRVRVTGEAGTTIEWTCTKIFINGSI